MSKAIALLPLIMIGACASDPEIGRAVSQNIVAQAVDMNPQYAGVPIEGGVGDRNVAAYQRYLKGTVKQPRADASFSVGAGGGGTPQ